MSWKTIVTFLTDLELDKPLLDAAIALAAREDAHLDILCLGVDPTQPEAYFAGAYSAAVPLHDLLADAEKQASEIEAWVRTRMKGETCRWSARTLMTPFVGINQTVAEAARFADVAVVGKPYAPGRGQNQVSVLEGALFGASVPVLVVPDGGLPGRFRRVILAWNESPEALRAVRAVLPTLKKAETCGIVVIDPPRHGPDRSDPGGRLAEMLARHGVRPEVRVLARSEPSIAALLARHALETGADLLVMGAYGHSRLRESILGGATRATLEATDVPVLMVH